MGVEGAECVFIDFVRRFVVCGKDCGGEREVVWEKSMKRATLQVNLELQLTAPAYTALAPAFSATAVRYRNGTISSYCAGK